MRKAFLRKWDTGKKKLTEALPEVGNGEGNFVVYGTPDNTATQGRVFVMFSFESGKYWRNESSDKDSFNPRDAEEVDRDEMGREIDQSNFIFVKSGTL